MSYDKKQFKGLIEETLKEIDAYSESAVNLLLGTAAQESAFGTYLVQIKGPAKGAFQMEPATYQDISNRLGRDRQLNLLDTIGMDAMPRPKDMVYNLKLAIAMARYKYLLIPVKLPDSHNIMGLARYYKKYYNTHLGKATIEDFIANYRKYVE